MRLRLRLLLPFTLSLLVAAGFLFAALAVGPTVRMAQPGYRADEATRIVVLWGILTTAVVAVTAALIARWVARPLDRMRDAAARLAEDPATPPVTSPVAEIQDILRGIQRAGAELRERHSRELQERAELAGLVDAVSEGILQVDAQGRIVRVNRAGAALLGLPPEPRGRTVASLVRNGDLRLVLRRAAEGEAARPAEVVLEDRRVLVVASPLPGGGAAATFLDLTDLYRLEAVRRDFVANASHELKTPLTSIRGYTETLLGGDLPEPERHQFLETIARNAARLQHIVDDLLDLSRIESGSWRPELVAVTVAEVAAAAWLPFADAAEGHDIAWGLVGDPDARAAADRPALEQVFTNLYDNALRYTPPGGRITVRIAGDATGPADPGRRADAGRRPAGWVLAEVADSGSGIPSDALPRIFERFYRVDPARSRAEGGTGLGLSIVKHVIETMGGAVTAESQLRKGTTIRFWLGRA